MANRKQDTDGVILTRIIEDEKLSMKEKYYMLNGYLEAKGADWTTELLTEPKSLLLYVFYYGSSQLFKHIVKSNEKIKEILSHEHALNPVFLSIVENPYNFDAESQIEYLNLIKSCSGNNYKKKIEMKNMKSVLKTDANLNLVELLLIHNNPEVALQIAKKFKISVNNKDMKQYYMHKFCKTILKKYPENHKKRYYTENLNRYILFLEKQGCAIKSPLLGGLAVQAYDYLKNNHDMKKIVHDFLNLSSNKEGLELIENAMFCYEKKDYDWLYNTVAENDDDRLWQNDIYKFLARIEISFFDNAFDNFHKILKVRREKVDLDNQFSTIETIKNKIKNRL